LFCKNINNIFSMKKSWPKLVQGGQMYRAFPFSKRSLVSHIQSHLLWLEHSWQKYLSNHCWINCFMNKLTINRHYMLHATNTIMWHFHIYRCDVITPIYMNSHLKFEFEGKIKFIAFTCVMVFHLKTKWINLETKRSFHAWHF